MDRQRVGMTIPRVTLILCVAAVVFCGTSLSCYGDVIAEKTGMGRAWIWLILTTSSISMLELITSMISKS